MGAVQNTALEPSLGAWHTREGLPGGPSGLGRNTQGVPPPWKDVLGHFPCITRYRPQIQKALKQKGKFVATSLGSTLRSELVQAY